MIAIPKTCDTTVEYNTQEYIIFAAIAGSELVIFIISLTILHILYPKRLFSKGVLILGFSEMAWAAHVCRIISGRAQGWNQWYSWLQDGFCITLYTQNINAGLFVQQFITLGFSAGIFSRCAKQTFQLAGDTRILQDSPAHPRRIVSHPHLARLC